MSYASVSITLSECIQHLCGIIKCYAMQCNAMYLVLVTSCALAFSDHVFISSTNVVNMFMINNEYCLPLSVCHIFYSFPWMWDMLKPFHIYLSEMYVNEKKTLMYLVYMGRQQVYSIPMYRNQLWFVIQFWFVRCNVSVGFAFELINVNRILGSHWHWFSKIYSRMKLNVVAWRCELNFRSFLFPSKIYEVAFQSFHTKCFTSTIKFEKKRIMMLEMLLETSYLCFK